MKYEWQRILSGKVSSRILPPPDHIKLTTEAFLMTASQHGILGGYHENSTEEASIQLTFLCKTNMEYSSEWLTKTEMEHR
jgi:hypothetical protein